MIHSVGTTREEAIGLMQERRSQILEKLQSGETEEAIVTGGNAFTETVWSKMLESVDTYLDQVKEDQKVRFEKRDKEQEEKELLLEQQRKHDLFQESVQLSEEAKALIMERAGASMDVPYGYLAKNGVIEYNGVIFVCDEIHNAICLGDMTNPADVLTIPLAEGGCLKVNRDNLGELSKAISMFSPEDIRRIMQAIATDTKCQQMQLEMDETVHSISGSTTIASKTNDGEAVTAEQIAELFRNKED